MTKQIYLAHTTSLFMHQNAGPIKLFDLFGLFIINFSFDLRDTLHLNIQL